jgi:hypothetical protein
MFVRRPQLNALVRVQPTQGSYEFGEVFLNQPCCSASALA